MNASLQRPRTVLALHPALCADQLVDSTFERLDRVTRLLDREPLSELQGERATRLLAEAEVLISSWGCPSLDREVLDRAPALRLVAHAAGTVKQHVTEACYERGLLVSSAAAANAIPVAEFTLAAILFANKGVLELARRYQELRAGRLWSRELPGLGNYRKRVGIVGASHVGRRVLELLRPHDLECLLADPTVDGEEAASLGARATGLDELLCACDVVSLHAPLLPSTRGLLDARRLARLRDGSTLINTARGAIVDADALEAELVSGRIRAVIDTTDPEVLPPDSPLYDLPNVLLTPHVAGSLGAETLRMMELAIDEVERFASGAALAHGVGRDDWGRIA